MPEPHVTLESQCDRWTYTGWFDRHPPVCAIHLTLKSQSINDLCDDLCGLYFPTIIPEVRPVGGGSRDSYLIVDAHHARNLPHWRQLIDAAKHRYGVSANDDPIETDEIQDPPEYLDYLQGDWVDGNG